MDDMTNKLPSMTAWSKDVIITDDDWKKFESAAQLQFNYEDRKEIFSIINRYFVVESFYRHGASPRATKKALLPIREQASKLRNKLKKLDILNILEETADHLE